MNKEGWWQFSNAILLYNWCYFTYYPVSAHVKVVQQWWKKALVIKKNSSLLHSKVTGQPLPLKKCNFGCVILPEITWNVFFCSCSLLWRSLQLVDNHQTSNKNLEQWENLQELCECFWFHIIIWMTFSSNQPLLSNLK